MIVLRTVRAIRNHRLLKIAYTGVLSGILFCLVLVAERLNLRASTQGNPSSTQSALFAYWSVDNGFNSSVVLNNASNIELTVRPTLYNLEGRPLSITPVILAPRQQLVASVADWIEENGRGDDFKQGNLILDYYAPESPYLGTQVVVSNSASSLSFDVPPEMPMSFESSRLEGMWWRPDQATRYNLVLSNARDSDVIATVNVSDIPGTGGSSLFDVALSPHQTQVIDLDDKTLSFPASAKGGKAGGISITHTGEPGAVLAYGMLSKKENGFCSRFVFRDTASSQSQTLAAAHLLIGKPDLSGFPAQTSFTSVALFRNASDAPITVMPSVSLIHNTAPQTISLPARHLLPQQVAVLDIGDGLKRAGLRGPFTGAGLTFNFNGQPGALLAHVTSFDQTHNHVFDVPVKEPILAMNRHGGSYPWDIDGDTQSIIHVRNTKDQRAHFTLQLDYEGGSYTLPLQTLAPQQEVAVDIRQLRDSQTKDSIDRVIPLDITSGQATWNEHGREALIGRVEIFNTTKGISSSFSCEVTCCPPDTSSIFCTPEPIGGPPGGNSLVRLMEMQRRDCDGVQFGPFDVTQSATWTSSNTAIATIGPVTSTGCRINRVGLGATTIRADFLGVDYMTGGLDNGCEVFFSAFTDFCQVDVVTVTIFLRHGTGMQISADNAGIDAIRDCIGSTALGTIFSMGTTCPRGWRTTVEIVGTASPSNYTAIIVLHREIVERRAYDNMTLIASSSKVADDSDQDFRDDDPQSGGSNGKVYDLDGPLTGSTSNTPLNGIRRRRVIYRQWATIGANGPKVSADFFWFHRLSVIKTSTGDQLRTDVTGDNIAGTGTTKLTWNLQ